MSGRGDRSLPDLRHALRLGTGMVLAAALALSAAAAQAQETARRAHDTSQPIEINADSLELQQDASLAIFSGNVIASQGEIRLRADTLRVYYREGEGAEDGPGATISRIDALGNVFVSSPQETAQGKVGVYDVEKRLITLSGSVVLTRGENVIRGERMVLNLDTGRSRVEGGSASAGKKDRVRALFVPPKKAEDRQ